MLRNWIGRHFEVTEDPERFSKLEPGNRQLYGLEILFYD